MSAQDEFLTNTEAAQMLRLKPGTLSKWRYLGQGPKSTKAGAKVLYRRSDVEEWLDAQGAATVGRSA